MHEVNVTEFRKHLPKYLSNVAQGMEIVVTSHGQAIARIMPPIDTKAHAIKQLQILRHSCKVGDVVTPVAESWDVDNDHT